jgi:tRNA pseudouridine38/39 synthase
MENAENLESLSKEELLEIIKTLKSPLRTTTNDERKRKLNEEENNISKKQRRNKEFDINKYVIRRVALKIIYLGWNYHGFVVQTSTDQTVEVNLKKYPINIQFNLSDIYLRHYRKRN